MGPSARRAPQDTRCTPIGSSPTCNPHRNVLRGLRQRSRMPIIRRVLRHQQALHGCFIRFTIRGHFGAAASRSARVGIVLDLPDARSLFRRESNAI